MKQAKRHGGKPRCGNCASMIKLRHDHGRVACTIHLTVVTADHAAECVEYEAVAEQPEAARTDASAQSMDGPVAS